MKTVEELYRKHNNVTHGFEFAEALAEHDKEIISLIDDMIDGITAFDSPRDMWDKGFDNGYKKALTELKEKLK